MPSIKVCASLLALGLAACGPHLDTRSPSAVDLSGTWQLDAARSDAPQVPGRRADPDMRGGNAPPESDSPHLGGPTPLLSMVTTTRMTIAQDATSMGIEYPGSPYRDLKWGTQKRGLFTIDAGWDDKRQLVVVTKSEPLNVREVYALQDVDTLVLQIDLQGKHFESRHMTRVFVRQPAPSP
jgi:hypothetical protein